MLAPKRHSTQKDYYLYDRPFQFVVSDGLPKATEWAQRVSSGELPPMTIYRPDQITETFTPYEIGPQLGFRQQLARDQERSLFEAERKGREVQRRAERRVLYRLAGPGFMQALTGASINTRLDDALRIRDEATKRADELTDRRIQLRPEVTTAALMEAARLQEENRVANARGEEAVRMRNAERERADAQSVVSQLNTGAQMLFNQDATLGGRAQEQDRYEEQQRIAEEERRRAAALRQQQIALQQQQLAQQQQDREIELLRMAAQDPTLGSLLRDRGIIDGDELDRISAAQTGAYAAGGAFDLSSFVQPVVDAYQAFEASDKWLGGRTESALLQVETARQEALGRVSAATQTLRDRVKHYASKGQAVPDEIATALGRFDALQRILSKQPGSSKALALTSGDDADDLFEALQGYVADTGATLSTVGSTQGDDPDVAYTAPSMAEVYETIAAAGLPREYLTPAQYLERTLPATPNAEEIISQQNRQREQAGGSYYDISLSEDDLLRGIAANRTAHRPGAGVGLGIGAEYASNSPQVAARRFVRTLIGNGREGEYPRLIIDRPDGSKRVVVGENAIADYAARLVPAAAQITAGEQLIERRRRMIRRSLRTVFDTTPTTEMIEAATFLDVPGTDQVEITFPGPDGVTRRKILSSEETLQLMEGIEQFLDPTNVLELEAAQRIRRNARSN